jgi:hypothetical protein
VVVERDHYQGASLAWRRDIGLANPMSCSLSPISREFPLDYPTGIFLRSLQTKGGEIVKRYKFFASLLITFASLPVVQAWAADPSPAPEKMPAILASLDAGKVTVLDDKAAAAIRGQAYQYVLVKTFLNPFDFAPDIAWTLNPLDFRYGAWGGLNWTAGGPPADNMDTLFMFHDGGLISNDQLAGALALLPNTPNAFWGNIYVPSFITPGSNLPANSKVWVAGGSVVGGKLYFGFRSMPFPEYARREALIGISLLGVLP